MYGLETLCGVRFDTRKPVGVWNDRVGGGEMVWGMGVVTRTKEGGGRGDI